MAAAGRAGACADARNAGLRRLRGRGVRVAAEDSGRALRQFRKAQGKATVDPRGDPVWQGTQAIGGLINTCYVYKRGEGARYEYRCDSSGFGAEPSQPPEKAKQIAEAVKAAFQAADPTLVWFEDPATRALAGIDGFQGTQGWYGGYVKNKSMVARVEIVLSNVTGNATIVTVFAKPLTRRDLK